MIRNNLFGYDVHKGLFSYFLKVGMFMENVHNDFFRDVKSYFEVLEKELSEYTGYEIKLSSNINEDEGTVDLSADACSPVNYPPTKEFLGNIINTMMEILGNSVNSKETLDWELLEKLRKKMSVLLIFGDSCEEKEEYNRMQFLNDLILIGHKSYEGNRADIGVIFSNFESIKEVSSHYEFKVIYFDTEINLKELFDSEKPFLKLVDGETFSLLVNDNFKVYGLAASTDGKTNISELIIQTFENARLKMSIEVTKEALADMYDSFLEKKHYEKIEVEKLQLGLKEMLILMKKNVQKVATEFKGNSPGFIYFKLNNGELNVYNTEDFIVSYSKTKWRLKNYHILQFVLMRHLLLRTQLYFLAEKSLDNSTLLNNVIAGTNILVNTIKKLAQTNTSSILMFTSIKPNEIVYSDGLNVGEAKESLSNLPLKGHPENYLYLKTIRENDIHLNVKDVGVPFLCNICSIDGAVVLDDMLNILSFGEVIEIPSKPNGVFGTGTSACKAVSENGGLAIKVSEDGDVKVYSDGVLILSL